MPSTKGAVADVAQEQLFKQIQEQFFGGIYGFSDEEETLDDLDKRYKHLAVGLKGYTRQKKRQGAERTPTSTQDS